MYNFAGMTNGGKEKYSPVVCIAGAGAAGISAALCAGKMGWEVHLAEREQEIGGTVRRGQLHTLTGFLNLRGEVIDSVICREFAARAAAYSKKEKRGKYWVFVIDSSRYTEIVTGWLAEFPAVQVHTFSSFESVFTEAGRVRSVSLRNGRESVSYSGNLVLVDATGDAQLAALADKHAVRSDPQFDSFALTLMAEISGAAPALMERVALKARLEKELAGSGTSVWIDIGSADNKIAVKINSVSSSVLAADADRIATALKNSSGLKIMRLAASEISNRNGNQIIAEQAGEATPGNSFLVSWPFETWRGGEVHIEDPPEMPFLLSEKYLRAHSYANLYAAGKSAGVPRPFASAARAVGSCWTMGEQVVKMIARSAR